MLAKSTQQEPSYEKKYFKKPSRFCKYSELTDRFASKWPDSNPPRILMFVSNTLTVMSMSKFVWFAIK